MAVLNDMTNVYGKILHPLMLDDLIALVRIDFECFHRRLLDNKYNCLRPVIQKKREKMLVCFSRTIFNENKMLKAFLD